MSISYRVMKTHEFKNSVYYRIACDCTDEEHDLTLELDWDDGILTLHFFGNLEVSKWGAYYNWFERQWWKIKKTFDLWFNGYFEVNYEMMILDEEHLDSFIEALQEGKDKFGTFKKWLEEKEKENAKSKD